MQSTRPVRVFEFVHIRYQVLLWLRRADHVKLLGVATMRKHVSQREQSVRTHERQVLGILGGCDALVEPVSVTRTRKCPNKGEKVRPDVESLGVRARLVDTAHSVDNDATCGGRWVKWA